MQKKVIIEKLLMGINKVGLDNISKLSQYVDIPVETARYMIWKELPGHAINIRVSLNLSRIGLQRWISEIQPANRGLVDAVESILKDELGLLYMARTMPAHTLIASFGIPFGDGRKLRSKLERLVQMNLLERFTLEKVEQFSEISFNPSFYDFQKSEWSFRLEDVDRYQMQQPFLPTRVTSYRENAGHDNPSTVDYKDLLILKSFQEQVPKRLSDLSNKIGIDQHGIRYHYNQHVLQMIQGYYFRIIPKDMEKDMYCSFKYVYEPISQQDFLEARRVAQSLPFTVMDWKTSNRYGWCVSCPGIWVNTIQEYVSSKFSKIRGELKFLMVDSTSEYTGLIPYRLFSEKGNCWNYNPRIMVPAIRVRADH